MWYRIAAFTLLATLAGLALGASLLQDPTGSGEKAAGKDRITGVRSASDGSDGVDAPRPSIRGVTNPSGSIRSVERIEGISTPVLQNLETVLKMQEPEAEPEPVESAGGGSASAAAELLAPEPVEPMPADEADDDRDLHVEFSEIEKEGS